MAEHSHRSPELQQALELISRELLYVIQSREKNSEGELVGLWQTRMDLGDRRPHELVDGSIKGKARAYAKMLSMRENQPHLSWRVIQKDNFDFYMEGINDRKELERMKRERRRHRLAQSAH